MAKTIATRHPISWTFDALRLRGAPLAPADIFQAATPEILPIGIADLKEALALGYADFIACRTDAILLCVIYPVAGLVLSRLVVGYDILPLIFPLIAGFALLGPLLATGLYELSRRRERGEPLSWGATFAPFYSPAIGSMISLGLGLLAIFTLWLVTAAVIYDFTLGPKPPVSAAAFVHSVFHTGPGLMMTLLGVGSGAVFAAVVLVISVVSFPLLLDRNVGVETAVRTSVAAFRLNRTPLLIWGLIIAGGLVLGSAPFLIGLAIVMPVLGHATWHLYRRLVV